jgi:citronellol/citronellal dehydrogenase
MGYQSVFRPGLFEGTTSLVTGGGSGIGRCVAHEIASLGGTVVIVGRDPAKLERVRKEIEAAGGRVTTHVCDIRDEVAVGATIDAVLAEHGRIDHLVNNAGGQFMAPLKSLSTNGFEAVVRTNLTGGFIFMREVHARWMERHGGAIVNMIADMWHGLPNVAHTAAARAAMHNLTQTAACEWAACGVRVNCIAPGLIVSSGFDNYSGEAVPGILGFARKIPAQRFGTVAEVSAAIVFLLSPAASYITGSCIRVDGGSPLAGPAWQPEAHDKSIPYQGFHLDSLPMMLRKGGTQPG